MLKTYFFVPANNDRFLSKIEKIGADEIILDLEDTVPLAELGATIEKISKVEAFKSHYIRPNLYPNDVFDVATLASLTEIGFKRFVLPKLETIDQLELIVNKHDSLELILLIEHPKLYLDLSNILSSFSGHLTGIGIGAHDFSMNTNHMHYDTFISKLRVETAIYAAAYELECIDTASMVISNEEVFKHDCLDAFNSGCTGKFLIHPNQLKNLNETEYFSDSEINWAKKALNQLSRTKESDLSAISIDGKVLERPHLKRIKQIKDYLEL